jgi:tetratricopeptide (TPR) repeat protein
MARKKITGVGIGTPLVSASLSWENVDPGGAFARALDRGCLVLPGGRLPKVRQVSDPVLLGVHPAPHLTGFASPAGEPARERVPAYVPRDIDGVLRDQLANSCFVILVGDSSAGKSRAAFEAVSLLGDHVLIVPGSHEALTAAIDKAAGSRHCVVWLDDLEGYLGAGGLSRADIMRVLGGRRSHRVIVGTLRSAEEALLTEEGSGEESGWQARQGAREVLELAYRIRLPRMFSQPEIERAKTQAWDPRIANAVARASEYGVAEYLAAGPELMRDWENAWSPNTDLRAPSHPRAAALIAAAVDIRRGGFTAPLPRALVTEVHEHYLQERGGPRLRPEPVANAWAWATRTRRATTALLQSVEDEHVLVFDYLLDAVQRSSRPGDYVPDSVLAAALPVCAPFDADNMATVAYRFGRYQFAATAWLRAYSALAEDLGPEHPDTLAARESHANALRELGRPAEAESEYRAITEIGARVFGPEHPRVLSSRAGWAFALTRQGKSTEAEEELRAVREIASRVLGPEHDVTMSSRHLHAIALHGLGRLAEAEAENRSVLAIWTRDFGPEDANTLYSRGNLASVLYEQGRREAAEEGARTVLDIRTRILGPEHPDTLHTRAFRANVLRELGRPAEAESEYRAITEIGARVFGPEHPQVLSSRAGWAFTLIRLGRSAEAEEELRAVRDTSSRVLGPEHNVTVTSRHLRAIALERLGRLAEAEAENRSVLAICTRDFGPDNTSTLYSRGNLARVLYKLGRRDEAENEAHAVLDIRTRILGPDHPDTEYIQSLLTSIQGGA